METETKWQFSEENEKNLTLMEARFILAQAEKQLIKSTDVSNMLVTRATVLLSIIITVLCVLIGYIFHNWSIAPSVITAATIAGYLGYTSYGLARNIQGHDYKCAGNTPVKLLHDWFFQEFPNSEARMIQLYVYEIKGYQDAIEYNKTKNQERWKVFHKALWTIIGTIPLSIALYLLVNLCFTLRLNIRSL